MPALAIGEAVEFAGAAIAQQRRRGDAVDVAAVLILPDAEGAILLFADQVRVFNAAIEPISFVDGALLLAGAKPNRITVGVDRVVIEFARGADDVVRVVDDLA